MKNIIIGGRYVDNVHLVDKNGKERTITNLYIGVKHIWELLIGFVFTKDKYTLNTKDNYIIKCKDQ